MNKHYCYGGIEHIDICNCSCDSCISFKKELHQKEFNKKLSEKIKEQNKKYWENL